MDHARPSTNVMHGACEDARRACAKTLLYFSCLKHVNEIVLGKSRQAGSPAKAKLPLPIVTHQSLDPAARALKRQASCLLRGLTSEQSCTRTLDRQRTLMHSNTRQALNESTRSVYAKWYWVNHGRLTSERQAHQRTQTRQARALKRQASCLCTRTLEHELKRQASCLCTRTLEHDMVLGKSRQDNHALEHKSRQAHQRTIMHSNTRTLEHEMVLGKSRQDNHALEHSTG